MSFIFRGRELFGVIMAQLQATRKIKETIPMRFVVPQIGSKPTSAARASGWILGAVLGTVAVAPLMAQSSPSGLWGFPSPTDWPMFGQNSANTASNFETAISVHTAPSLATKWKFTTGGDVSARAAVVDGVAYFPDWGGNITAVNAGSGAKIWSKQISSYGLAAGTVARTSPAVANGIVYIGTQYVAPVGSAPQPKTGW